MFSLLLHPLPDAEDLLSADLWESQTLGIVEEAGGIRAFFDDSTESALLITRFAQFAPELRREQSIDWAQVSRDAWPPMEVGKRLFLVPPWSTAPTPEGRLRLEIYPGMACGTGRHPATQLCLAAIERFVQPGHWVLDVGTGSGILSAAAGLMGAGWVIGCDIDEDNVRIAQDRLVSDVFIGSAEAVQAEWADVVVANIDAATIERLAPEFRRVQKKTATLILSGFPDWDLPAGFKPREILELDEWRCFVCD